MSSPWVAGADMIAPKGYKLSEIYQGGTVMVGAILSGDLEPLDEVHKRQMEGRYGKVLQAAAEAGEYWANKGVVGGLRELASSIKWWLGLDDDG